MISSVLFQIDAQKKEENSFLQSEVNFITCDSQTVKINRPSHNESKQSPPKIYPQIDWYCGVSLLGLKRKKKYECPVHKYNTN